MLLSISTIKILKKFSEIVATPISLVYVTKCVLKIFFSICCFDNYDNNNSMIEHLLLKKLPQVFIILAKL